MRNRLRFWKYPIFIVMLLLMIAAFTLVYELSDTATAPHEQIDASEPTVMETPDITDEPENGYEDPELSDEPADESEDEAEDEVEDEPEEEQHPIPSEDGYITFYMDDSEIARGVLVLVNHDHTFELPARMRLVNTAKETTASFRVLGQNYLLRDTIIEPLDEMMHAFISATGNNTVAIISGFRNYIAQERILNDHIRRMGRREALRWAAEPGHSEHHTGLAFDFGIYAGGSISTFEGTGVTSWFRRNAHNYGFILRYPLGKTHITQTAHEPWHFRYVGLPHSVIMFQKNWVLEEYIERLRDYTFEEPFEFEHKGVLHVIYFTTENEIKLPLHSEFEISGNNVDGFIVTAIPQEHDPSEEVDYYV